MMDAPDRRNGQTEKQTDASLCKLFVCLFVSKMEFDTKSCFFANECTRRRVRVSEAFVKRMDSRNSVVTS